MAPPGMAPAGCRRVVVDHEGDQPAAALRVQDLFGATTHPTVAGVGYRSCCTCCRRPADRCSHHRSARALVRAVVRVRKGMAGRYPKARLAGRPANAPARRR